MRPHYSLTRALVAAYGNRKEQGRVSILADLNNDLFYAVPRTEEHIDFAKKLVDDDSPNSYARLIPSHIDIKDGEVVSFLTGVSGLEIRLGVRHTSSDLQRAHERAKEFCRRGEVPVASNLLVDKIVYRYSVENFE